MTEVLTTDTKFKIKTVFNDFTIRTNLFLETPDFITMVYDAKQQINILCWFKEGFAKTMPFAKLQHAKVVEACKAGKFYERFAR